MGRSTWPKRQCCPQALASWLSGPLPRTAKAGLEVGICIDISSIFIQVSQGKGKPSACPGLLVPVSCFAVVSHRSSPPEARARASGLSPLPSLALPSQHAEQADSVHAQVTGEGPIMPLLCSRPRVFGQVGCTDMTMQRGERCTEEEKDHRRSQEERVLTHRLFPSAAGVPRRLCCATAVALAEQVLQPFVDCPTRFPPLFQHQQNHSVLKKRS